jgi:flagellar motor component MotA
MKFSVTRLIALMGLLFILLGPMTLGGRLALFIDLPSIIIVFGFAFFMLLLCFGRDFLKFIPKSLCVFCFSPQSPNQKYAEIALYGSRIVVGGASIATLVSYVHILSGMADPSSIGLGMSVSLLPILYGLILSEVYFAIVYKAFADSASIGTEVPAWINLFLPIVVVLVVLLIFLLVILAFSVVP